MAEFERVEKVSYLRIFTHNINKRKFMISCCDYIFFFWGEVISNNNER